MPKRRIVVTAQGRELDSNTDPRFGRCPFFIVTEGGQVVASEENSARDLGSGAGIQAAEQLLSLQADELVTGDVGPRALLVLAAANVRVFLGCSGSVRQALADHLAGRLREANGPIALGHHDGHGQGMMHGTRKD